MKLPERETAAYALLRGIDYVIEECPMVEGNTQHRYKDAITQLEESVAGNQEPVLLRLPEEGGRPLSRASRTDGIEIVACISCGAPTVGWDGRPSLGARSARRRPLLQTKKAGRTQRARQTPAKTGADVRPANPSRRGSASC